MFTSSSCCSPLDHTVLLSFPTRRSSDLRIPGAAHELMIGPFGDLHGNRAIAETHCAALDVDDDGSAGIAADRALRSEEHTSELQSLRHLVCRLLLEKKKNQRY